MTLRDRARTTMTEMRLRRSEGIPAALSNSRGAAARLSKGKGVTECR